MFDFSGSENATHCEREGVTKYHEAILSVGFMSLFSKLLCAEIV